MSKIYKKILKISGLSIAGLLFLLLLAGWSFELFFKDKLVIYAVEQINHQINAKISYSSFNFTFWKTFPNASVEFKQFSVQSTVVDRNQFKEKDDSLLRAGSVYFEFSIFNLLQNKYVLKQIQISDGTIILKNFQNGTANFDIIKKHEGKETTSEIKLKAIIFKNCHIRYIHYGAGIDIVTHTNRSKISGDIQSEQILLNLDMKLLVQILSVRGINYIYNKNISIDSKLSIEHKSLYRFASSDIQISGLPFVFESVYRDTGKNLFLKIEGNDLALDKLVNIASENFIKESGHYNTKGECNLKFVLSGSLNSKVPPVVKLSILINKGFIEERLSKIKLSDLELNCIYSNGIDKNNKLSYIQINKLSSNFGLGSFSIHGYIENLLSPSVNLNTITSLDLNNLKNFLRLDTFDILEGHIKSNLQITGSLPKIKGLKISDAKNLNYKGYINVQTAGVKLKNNDYHINQINGLIELNNDIIFKDLSLSLHDNPIKVSGKMVNGLPFIFGLSNETYVDAELKALKLDLSKYFVKGQTQNSGTYSREFLFPTNISFDLKIDINEFKLNKFNAKWVKGKLNYKPGMFVIQAASLETCEGNLAGNGAIIQNIQNDFLVKGQVKVNKLNINQVFVTTNNFAQQVLKSEHLKGKISGNINFSSVWNNRLEFKPEHLIMDADVTIFNGELINFKPLYGLSRFIALEELQSVKFSTLRNTIYIHDKQIIIPQMEIQSNAFNIVGAGTHTFDNQYKYKIRVLLSEFLFRKAKSAKKENEEYGEVEDDGLGKTTIPLRIEGVGNNYKINYDSKSALQMVSESLQKQKRELKEVLHDEFGWFKKDSTLQQNKKNSKRIHLDFDNQNTQKDLKNKNQPNNQKDSEDKPRFEFE